MTAVGLLLACGVAPVTGINASWDRDFTLSGLWLGLVISVGTTFLLDRLSARGNLVNVTSFFYPVSGVTAAMDWVLLGHPMSIWTIGGLGLIMMGWLWHSGPRSPEDWNGSRPLRGMSHPVEERSNGGS